MDNVVFDLGVADFSGLFSSFSYAERPYSVITGRTARFRTLDSDNIVLMPAGLRWLLDWDCRVKSSCCGVNTFSTSSNPGCIKFSSLATWYSIIHAPFESESSNVSLLTSSLAGLTPASSDVQLLMHWHLSQYGDILKWYRSDHTCPAVAAARHLQASRQMMPFIREHRCSHCTDDLLCVGMVQWHITDGHFQSFTRKWGHVAWVQQRVSPRMRGRRDYVHLHTAIKHLQYLSRYI